MMKHCVIGLMVVGLAATGLLAASDPNLPHDRVFTGAIGDNWNVANNWYELEVPDGNRHVYVGCPEYPNVSVTVYSGTTALSGHAYIGGPQSVGSMTVQAGATISTDSTIEVGSYDYFFDNTYLPFDIADDNDWMDGGTGTLTVNGTISSAAPIEIGSRGKGTLYLNSGGLIEVTNVGGDMYIGKEYHYYRTDNKTEVYHADGATVSIADNMMMATHHNQNESFYKFVGGGVVTTGTDGVSLGNFNIWNGIVWVDGGTATINIASPPGWGYMLFINYSESGQDVDQSGEGNDVPVLRLSGNNPLLKVNGWAAFTGAKLDLDANTLVIPGWQWVTVVDANSMAEHDDWQFGSGKHDSNDLTFTAGVDANIWSMKTDNDKVQIKVSKRGDMDKDSKYTVDDINPFVMALTDPNAYLLAYGIDPNLIGDCDYSGKLDTDDISPFVAFITGGASAVPEPACIGVIALGAAAFIRRRRRK